MLENILWFFAGALVHRALSYALGISAAKKMALFVYDYAILILDAVDKDLNRAIKEKHDSLWKSGLEEEQLEEVKQADKKLLTKWRAKVLAKFIVATPEMSFRTKNYLKSVDPYDRLKKLKQSLDKVEG